MLDSKQSNLPQDDNKLTLVPEAPDEDEVDIYQKRNNRANR